MGGSMRASVIAGLASGVCAAALMAGAPAPLLAQTAPASPAPPAAAPAAKPPAAKPKKPPPKKPASEDDDADEPHEVSGVTITAKRPPPDPPGSVVGDIKPELTLDPSDIQSYGVSTVTDLLNEIAPQTRSDRGRTQLSPVILVNGRRISSINEVQNIPTEAILRVEVLPEEVSLKYGYSADQRVVNIVLKPLFHAVTAEAVGGETARGGDPTGQDELDLIDIQQDTRVNLDLKYQAAGGLTDAQRDLSETTGGAPFSYAGNVESSPTGSPLLALPGQPTIAGIPAGVTAGQKLALSNFEPGVTNVTDTSADHSLVPATQALTANAVLTHPIFWGMNATFNATLGGTTSDALQGLPGVTLAVPQDNPFNPLGQPVTVYRYVSGAAPLQQTIDGWTGHLGMTMNRDVSDWRLSFTTAYNHADTITNTGTGLNATGLQDLLNQGSSSTLNPFGPLPGSMLNAMPLSSARLITDGGNVQILANGPLFKLPAGALYVSAKLGDTEARAESSSNMNPLDDQILARNDASGLLNIDVPIASRLHNSLGALGELHFNVNSAFDYYSDFGLLPTLGFGLNWTPIPGYNLIISETHDHQAPTISQLEGPVIATPGVKVFDYTTGQTVSITQLSGGNPALVADNRQVVKVGLTLKPLPKDDFTFTANYIYSHIADPIETFPSASAAIEAAFPMRFLRNADGDLEEENNTPLNFASQDREEIRWGINYSRPVGKQPPPPPVDRRAFRRRPGGGGQGAGAAGGLGFGSLANGGAGGPGDNGAGGASGQPGAGGQNTVADNGGGLGGGPGGGGRGFGGGRGGGGRGGGGRGFGGGGQQVGGRFQIALYHTIIFKDRFLVAPGGPVLDLLNGAAAGGAGGQYQQEIEAQMGYTNMGFGARMSADWRSATVVDGGALGSTGDLDFSSVATINLRLWEDFSQQTTLTAKYHILRGVRVTLNLNNLFDESIHVHDTGGLTPLIYQSAYLDPTGRVVSINLRKLFY